MELFSRKVIQLWLEKTYSTIKGMVPPHPRRHRAWARLPAPCPIVQCAQSTTVSDNTLHLLLFKLSVQVNLAKGSKVFYCLEAPQPKGKEESSKCCLQLVLNRNKPLRLLPEKWARQVTDSQLTFSKNPRRSKTNSKQKRSKVGQGLGWTDAQSRQTSRLRTFLSSL